MLGITLFRIRPRRLPLFWRAMAGVIGAGGLWLTIDGLLSEGWSSSVTWPLLICGWFLYGAVTGVDPLVGTPDPPRAGDEPPPDMDPELWRRLRARDSGASAGRPETLLQAGDDPRLHGVAGSTPDKRPSAAEPRSR